MKYKEEFFTAKDREEFIKLVLSKYKVKKETPYRRYYDLRKKFGERNVRVEVEQLVPEKKPSHTQILMIEDMKKYGNNITRDYLSKHGVNLEEFNWLKNRGMI